MSLNYKFEIYKQHIDRIEGKMEKHSVVCSIWDNW